MKKSLMILVILVIFLYPVSAANMYNHVYNGSSWVPALSTADGQQKYWINMANASYGEVQYNMTIGEKIIFNLEEKIDNFVEGWIRIVGSLIVENDLNVTQNLNVQENATIEGNLNVSEDVGIGGNLQVTGNVSGGSPVKIKGGLNVMNESGATSLFVNETTGDINITSNLNVEGSSIQKRISSSCSVGSSIRVINEDGTVECETDTDTIYTFPITTTYLWGGGGSCDGACSPQRCMRADQNQDDYYQVDCSKSVSSGGGASTLRCKCYTG